ncbi:MAG: hypothetical protein CML60_04350 [Rhodobacteraceae bacterium]|nr:hypothetical protein [Paracoccaceae bacterium]MBT25611.1 hypothetical protein [Paracoccaceae bacterium]
MIGAALALCFGGLAGQAAGADPLSGEKHIFVQEQGGARQSLGAIRFDSQDGFSRYTLVWDDERFADHFLSMRPFKCHEGPQKYWCHVPYPYENRRQVRADDLTDLEYDLLFLWKGATDYGINMWNGVYYRLKLDGDRIVGTLHEMNMDVLSAPPAPGNLRPISDEDLHAADADSHWLPRLVIE